MNTAEHMDLAHPGFADISQSALGLFAVGQFAIRKIKKPNLI